MLSWTWSAIFLFERLEDAFVERVLGPVVELERARLGFEARRDARVVGVDRQADRMVRAGEWQAAGGEVRVLAAGDGGVGAGGEGRGGGEGQAGRARRAAGSDDAWSSPQSPAPGLSLGWLRGMPAPLPWSVALPPEASPALARTVSVRRATETSGSPSAACTVSPSISAAMTRAAWAGSTVEPAQGPEFTGRDAVGDHRLDRGAPTSVEALAGGTQVGVAERPGPELHPEREIVVGGGGLDQSDHPLGGRVRLRPAAPAAPRRSGRRRRSAPRRAAAPSSRTSRGPRAG